MEPGLAVSGDLLCHLEAYRTVGEALAARFDRERRLLGQDLRMLLRTVPPLKRDTIANEILEVEPNPARLDGVASDQPHRAYRP